jgi:hypothetical protein
MNETCMECGGIGSTCLACREAIDDCECGPDAEPTPCMVCDGSGRAPEDEYAGATADVSDIVEWKDPQRGDIWDNLEVMRVDRVLRVLTVRGWFGDMNKQGGETIRRRRVPMAQCSVTRRRA